MTLIVALDPGPGVERSRAYEWARRICAEVKPYAAGFKVGLPALLKIGVERLKGVLSDCHAELMIADLKLADIGYIMSLVADELLNMGFNAVIAHAFTGYKDALENLSDTLRGRGKLITVAAMSHKGSEEIMDKVVEDLLDVSVKAGAWGVVMPATRPKLIGFGKKRGLTILSPGIGVQGAEPGTALCSGADYEIVGRSITGSPNPGEAARKIVEAQREAVAECRA